MKPGIYCLLVMAALLHPPPALAVWQGEVSVSVEETAGATRANWPIAVNLPLPLGAVRDASSLVLAGRAGPLPTQATVLQKWPDGSLRWVGLDGLISMRAHSRTTLKVATGKGVTPKKRLQVVESGSEVKVDTGAVLFSVPKTRFAIVDQLSMGRNMAATVGTIGTSMVVDGAVHTAGPPKTVRVVRDGPLRASIELGGPFGPSFSYLIRIDVYAGSPLVRVRHTYIKTGGTSVSQLERLSVDIPFLREVEGDYSAGLVGAKPLLGELGTERVVSFAQPDNLSYEVDEERVEGKLSGWFELAGSGGAVGLASRWFWQEYPKAVTMGANSITYDLWSPSGGTARIGVGSAKTHELVLWLARKGKIGKSVAPGVAEPLRGFVDPVWTARSGALRGAVDPRVSEVDEQLAKAAGRVRQRNAHERWDDCGWHACGGEQREVVRTGAFGMLNWGDWNFPGLRDSIKGTDAWGNLEYDTTQVLALAAAASNDARVFDSMVAAARHFMDVDTIHALPLRPQWVGMNHPKNPQHFTFELGGVDLGHTWTEGLISYYQLTGDERGLQVARGIADYLVARLAEGVLRGNPRQWGWPVIALLAVYDATGEAQYLEAATGYARSGMKAHDSSTRGWKLGILADAVAQLHAVRGDGTGEKWLRAYAEAVVEQRQKDIRYYPAVAYAGRIAANPQWLAAAQRRLDRLELGNWGKTFTINGRYGLRLDNLLAGQDPQVDKGKASRLRGPQ